MRANAHIQNLEAHSCLIEGTVIIVPRNAKPTLASDVVKRAEPSPLAMALPAAPSQCSSNEPNDVLHGDVSASIVVHGEPLLDEALPITCEWSKSDVAIAGCCSLCGLIGEKAWYTRGRPANDVSAAETVCDRCHCELTHTPMAVPSASSSVGEGRGGSAEVEDSCSRKRPSQEKNADSNGSHGLGRSKHRRATPAVSANEAPKLSSAEPRETAIIQMATKDKDSLSPKRTDGGSRFGLGSGDELEDVPDVARVLFNDDVLSPPTKRTAHSPTDTGSSSEGVKRSQRCVLQPRRFDPNIDGQNDKKRKQTCNPVNLTEREKGQDKSAEDEAVDTSASSSSSSSSSMETSKWPPSLCTAPQPRLAIAATTLAATELFAQLYSTVADEVCTECHLQRHSQVHCRLNCKHTAPSWRGTPTSSSTSPASLTPLSLHSPLPLRDHRVLSPKRSPKPSPTSLADQDVLDGVSELKRKRLQASPLALSAHRDADKAKADDSLGAQQSTNISEATAICLVQLESPIMTTTITTGADPNGQQAQARPIVVQGILKRKAGTAGDDNRSQQARPQPQRRVRFAEQLSEHEHCENESELDGLDDAALQRKPMKKVRRCHPSGICDCSLSPPCVYRGVAHRSVRPPLSCVWRLSRCRPSERCPQRLLPWSSVKTHRLHPRY